MPDEPQHVEIPNRALFKAAEVCDLLQVQPYVLRSWEAEFKDLGITRSGSALRVYRREDVERVLRIKHLLLIEGLTLAGVRRKLEEEAEPPLEYETVAAPAAVRTTVDPAVKDRIGEVKQGLRSILALLGAPAPSIAAAADAAEFALAPAPGSAQPRSRAHAEGVANGPRGNGSDNGTKTHSPRRKRSA